MRQKERSLRTNGLKSGALRLGKMYENVSHIVKLEFILSPYLVQPGVDHTYKAFHACVICLWHLWNSHCLMVLCRILKVHRNASHCKRDVVETLLRV